MALSATFTANFSSFYEAVDKADTKLKDFGQGADKVGARLNKMGDQFSGVKIVQEATIMAKAVEDIGGVSKLTEKELARLGATTQEAVAKMRALGMDVPKNIQDIADKTKTATKATGDWVGTLKTAAGAMGIAFSVGMVKDFVAGIFSAASAVKDLSDQWGVSTKAVQQWSAAAKASGVESETVGKSIQFMTAELAEGSDAYKAMLANIGLSYDELRQMPLEEAYREVIAAIGGITDETLQLDVALALTGTSSKKMIGAIRDGFLDAAAAQKYMSDETIKRLEAAEAAWEKFGNNVKIITGEFLGDFMRRAEVAFSSWGNYLTYLGKATRDTFITGKDSAGEWVRAMEEAAKASAKVKPPQLAPMASHGAPVKTAAQLAQEQKDKDKADAKALAAREKALAEFQANEKRYAAWKLQMLTGMSAAERQLLEDEKRLAHEGHGALLAATLKINETMPAWIKQTATQAKELTKMGEALANAAMQAKALQAVAAAPSLIKPTDWDAILKNAIPAGKLAADAKAAADARAKAIKDTASLTKGMTFASVAIDAVARSAKGAFGAVMRYVSQATDMVFEWIVAMRAAKLAGDAAAAAAATAQLAMGVATMGISIVAGLVVEAATAVTNVENRADRLRDTMRALREEFGVLDQAERNARSSAGKAVTGTAGPTGPTRLLMALRDAEKAIEGLADVTERFGGVVPKALRPMVESLMEMQGLPKALRDQLQGFADAPAWQTIEQRARDLGIEMSALGGGFNQQRLAAMGFGFFHDIEMFLEQGADLDGVLRGMSDELVTLGAQSLKTGAALPKSLEPYMKRLKELNLLVDENGNAIEDLTFKDLEDESLKAVVKVLEQIRELLANALPQAVDKFGRAFDRVPSGTGAFATVPGERLDASAATGGGMMTVVVEADGRQLSRIVAPFLPGEVRRLGLAAS